MATIEEAMRPLRDALHPRGSLNVTVLKLKPGCAVQHKVVQQAIKEIINYATIGKPLGEPESACMQLAKIVLMDSAGL